VVCDWLLVVRMQQPYEYTETTKNAINAENENSQGFPFLRGDFFSRICVNKWGTRWHNRLRHCAINRKVAGPIPNGVAGIFQ
jgi:hypothetical protein